VLRFLSTNLFVASSSIKMTMRLGSTPEPFR
jgi:hypothetical protein